MTRSSSQEVYPRPCPIPGHPQDDEDDLEDWPGRESESLVARMKAWLLHAPSERMPIPAAVVCWSGSWVMYETHVPGRVVGIAGVVATAVTWVTWARHNRDIRDAIRARRTPPPTRLGTMEAVLTAAAIAGWVTAAVTWGPLAGPVHLLSLTYLAGTAYGYWRLRRHPAVRAARQRRDEDAGWTAKKAWWHLLAHEVGLGDFDLMDVIPTHLGEKLLLKGSPNGTLASRIAGRPDAFIERLLHHVSPDGATLPYGRIDIYGTNFPGELIVEIRLIDPSVKGEVLHPAIDPGSRFAEWFPEVTSVREPQVWGLVPETGEPMEVQFWVPGHGGRTIGVYATTDWGKTTLLNCLRERITVMPDAILIQVNGAKVGDEMAWAPLAAATAAGSAQFEEGAAERILRTLEWGQLLITERTRTHVLTGDSVFQPTPEDPAVIFEIDEVDEVAKIPGVTPILEFLASKQRAAACSLVISGQRATQRWTGGAGVQANMGEAIVGLMTRASERRHVSGAEYDIPDISEYCNGEPGFWQVWDPRRKKITVRGRGFNIGTIGQQQKIIARRDPAGRPRLPGPPLIFDDLRPETTEDEGSRPSSSEPAPGSLRARLAAVVSLNTGGHTPRHTAPSHQAPAPAPPAPGPRAAATRPPARVIPGVPVHVTEKMLPLLAEGTTAQTLADTLRVGKTTAHKYLTLAREHGIAVLENGGHASLWSLVSPPGEAPAPPDGYTPIRAFAEAVVSGAVQVDDDTRAMLTRALELDRQDQPEEGRTRGHLTLLPTGTTGDDKTPSEGGSQ